MILRTRTHSHALQRIIASQRIISLSCNARRRREFWHCSICPAAHSLALHTSPQSFLVPSPTCTLYLPVPAPLSPRTCRPGAPHLTPLAPHRAPTTHSSWREADGRNGSGAPSAAAPVVWPGLGSGLCAPRMPPKPYGQAGAASPSDAAAVVGGAAHRVAATVTLLVRVRLRVRTRVRGGLGLELRVGVRVGVGFAVRVGVGVGVGAAPASPLYLPCISPICSPPSRRPARGRPRRVRTCQRIAPP